VHPRELSAVPLPRLASALENEGLLIDSVSPDLLRCHFPPHPIAGRLSIINRMRASDVIVERHEHRLVVRVIPAFSRICVGAAGGAVVAFSLIPGPLPSRIVSALLVGAAVLIVEYALAAAVLPVSILRAAHQAAASMAASAPDRPIS
jgi:hypothetical protein